MRRGRRLRRALVGMLAIAAVAAAGCGDEEREGGTITISETAQPDFLDPALSYTTNGWEPMWLVYTPLLTYRHAEGKEGTELIPGLAEELPEISADGRTYRLKLRPGLTYSDGTLVKASDFEHTISRVLALESPGSSLFLGIAGAQAYAERGKAEGDISGIETDDEAGAITIRLAAPDANFSQALATIFSGLVPSRTRFENLTKRPPPGVGAYVIARSSPNREFVLRRNEDFDIPGIPSGELDRITVRIVTSPDRQAQDVIRGKLDYMQDPPPPDLLPRIRRDHADRYRESVIAGTNYFFLNTRTPPFDKLAVRRAVNEGLDERALRRISGGLLAPTCNLLPPNIPGYEKRDPCPYGEPGGEPDIERARELVRRAGAEGASVRVWGPKQDPGPALSSYYADMLDEIGLEPKIQLIDFAVYSQVLGDSKTRAQTGFLSWAGEYPHPYSFLKQFLASAITPTSNQNVANVRDRKLDAEMTRLNTETDPRSVEDGWAELDRRVVDRAYVAVYDNPVRTTFMSDRLDAESCSTVHPVYGNDYSSFCLR
jgi:peptide/nickel transport system substrate-binding protein